jgi:hypothetical protein
MKHNITIAVAALAVLAAGCNARSSAKVTVAGCVQSAEQGLASSSDKKDIDKFMLTNASLVSSTASSSSASPSDPAARDRARADQAPPPADASAPPAPPADAAAPAAPAPTGTMYALDGNKSELRDHLNQRVEITGRFDRDNDKDKDSAAAGHQELHVDSVRQLASSCNP